MLFMLTEKGFTTNRKPGEPIKNIIRMALHLFGSFAFIIQWRANRKAGRKAGSRYSAEGVWVGLRPRLLHFSLAAPAHPISPTGAHPAFIFNPGKVP